MWLRKVIDFHDISHIKILNLILFSSYHPKLKKKKPTKHQNHLLVHWALGPIKNSDTFSIEKIKIKADFHFPKSLSAPHFRSYYKTELLQEQGFRPQLGCCHFFFSLKAFKGGSPNTLSRVQCPPKSAASPNSGLSPTASLAAASPPATLVHSLGMFCNFLSPCLCWCYFLQLESHFSFTLPPNLGLSKNVSFLQSSGQTLHSPKNLPEALSICAHWRAWTSTSTKEDSEHMQRFSLPCRARTTSCFSLETLCPLQCSVSTQHF